MNITTHKSTIKTIRQGDPRWFITAGNIQCPHAGFEINQQCPREYKLIITQCINNGWLKPVAHLKESEYAWELLQE